MSLSLKARLDKRTADEIAAGHGVSRASVFEHFKKGKLPPEAWSRTWYSRQHPHGRFSWLHVFETVLNVILELHGSEYLAGHLATHHPGLARAIVRAVVPASAFHPDSALHPDNPAYSAPIRQPQVSL